MDKDPEVKSYACDKCEKAYKSQRALRFHSRSIHEGIKKDRGPRKECEICSKVFHKTYEFKMHVSAHANPTAFKCDICEKAYKSQGALSFHNRSIHEGIKKDRGPRKECHICKRSLRDDYELRKHLAQHENPTPFKCDTCGKVLQIKRP